MIPVGCAGKSNRGNIFRYDPQLEGYIFNLQTTGLDPGDYLLNFTAGDDPLPHAAAFTIRSIRQDSISNGMAKEGLPWFAKNIRYSRKFLKKID